MNESFIAGIVLGALVAIALFARRKPPDQGRLSRIEGKLDALLRQQHIRFDPFADVPPSVAAAIQRGEKIEAIREYRVAAGVGLKEAKEFVEEVQRRQPSPSRPR